MTDKTPLELQVAIIQQQIERIEARQRAYEMHDPKCEAGQIQRDNVKASQIGFGSFGFKRPCTCWLSQSEVTE